MVADKCRLSQYAPLTNTDTDSADATDSPCISIRFLFRTESVYASAESDIFRIVPARSKENLVGPFCSLLHGLNLMQE